MLLQPSSEYHQNLFHIKQNDAFSVSQMTQIILLEWNPIGLDSLNLHPGHT